MTLGALFVDWVYIILALALMAFFVLGQVLDALMGRRGFGAFGNMLALTVGFYLGYWAIAGVPRVAVELRFAVAVGAAFLCLMMLAALKRFLFRA